jgi:hypothetical protein
VFKFNFNIVVGNIFLETNTFINFVGYTFKVKKYKTLIIR